MINNKFESKKVGTGREAIIGIIVTILCFVLMLTYPLIKPEKAYDNVEEIYLTPANLGLSQTDNENFSGTLRISYFSQRNSCSYKNDNGFSGIITYEYNENKEAIKQKFIKLQETHDMQPVKELSNNLIQCYTYYDDFTKFTTYVFFREDDYIQVDFYEENTYSREDIIVKALNFYNFHGSI